MDDKTKDSPFKKAMDDSVKLCECGHNKYHHTYLEKRDQSRSSYAGSYTSKCKQCEEKGKTCENFKEIKYEKSSLINKIKWFFNKKRN
ncbi:MAG: hypothetical protein K8Q89_09305 [Nitrosarchaeum sp.]|nr:hypothetical protein [Nitrosarchaeum sp.]